MKISKTETGYLLETASSKEEQALEQFVESLGDGNVASLYAEKLSLECELLRVKIKRLEEESCRQCQGAGGEASVAIRKGEAVLPSGG